MRGSRFAIVVFSLILFSSGIVGMMLSVFGQTQVPPGSVTIGVISGPVEAVFTGDNGIEGTTTLDTNNSVTFDSAALTVTNNGEVGNVVITVNGDPITVSPGQTQKYIGSVTIGVISGPVEAVFTGDNGIEGTTTLVTDVGVTFDSADVTITNNGAIEVVITVNGDTIPVSPGQTQELTSPPSPPSPADANGPYLTAVNIPVILDASASNPDLPIATYEWDLDNDGLFNDAIVVAPSFTSSQTGIFTVAVKVTDTAGEFFIAESLVVVYDPSGGFVTGGGWIDSPAGAYTADTSLTGKANFGFVSKYKQGATIPTGVTEFQFKVADLNFHSDSYEWLVVAGPKAMFKGAGTINGVGSFGFILSAIDEKLTPSTDTDLFRIKIVDQVAGTLIYDNKVGETDDNANPTTAISDGSIVIKKAN